MPAIGSFNSAAVISITLADHIGRHSQSVQRLILSVLPVNYATGDSAAVAARRERGGGAAESQATAPGPQPRLNLIVLEAGHRKGIKFERSLWNGGQNERA
ncbi:hypothetical protein O3G_MSEX011582 [Manduca sexta]|uniref:Uncharacterized protein n=1 Tax=Manduca sexta TaxID=7130 RepID=A0A922CVF7_MANSE|nr:hypothetical protein O3G_MSEX011582 [Manduca sexta]